MKTTLSRSLAFLALAAGFSAPAARAVILAGASGGSDTANNTTRAQLEAELGITFAPFDNVIRYSDSSGVYLGYDPVTNDVWVLTALHVTTNATEGSSVTIQGNLYQRQADGPNGWGLQVGGDLRLVRYHAGDNSVPSLPTLTLANVTPTLNSPTIMMGYGVNRSETATVGANTPDDTLIVANGQRGYGWGAGTQLHWGTNNIDLWPDTDPGTAVLAEISGSMTFAMDYDRPGANQWLDSNEGIAALGDSGGGVFINVGGVWQLAGIHFLATRGDVNNNGTTIDDTFSNFTGEGGVYGGTIATNISTYQPAIAAALGVTLVPEPSGIGMGLLAAGLLGFRRRR